MNHRTPRSTRPAASPQGPKSKPVAAPVGSSRPPGMQSREPIAGEFFGPGQYAKRVEPGAGRDANGVAADAKGAVERAASGGGEPLRADLRERFESSLGADLSAVRIHRSAASAEASTAVGARAYTLGNEIHFGAGRYQPDAPSGMRLLAHEVAHSAQQARTSPQRQHKLEVSTPGDAHEAEADRAADAMIRGERATVGRAHPHIARDPEGEPDAGPPVTARTGTGHVKADGTKVVDGPRTGANEIETLAKDATVQLTHDAGNYYKVVTPSGAKGYVQRSDVDVESKSAPSDNAPVAESPAKPADAKGHWTSPKADRYPHESVDPRVLTQKPASWDKVWNPNAPDGWRYWPPGKKILPRGKQMTDEGKSKPMGTFVQDIVNGELIAARTEWHSETILYDKVTKQQLPPVKGVYHAANLMVPLEQPKDLEKKAAEPAKDVEHKAAEPAQEPGKSGDTKGPTTGALKRPNGLQEIIEVFGQPGTNLGLHDLACGPKGKVQKVYCHNKIAPLLKTVFDNIVKDGKAEHLHYFAGCYNERPKVGGEGKSVHAWGIAVDLNPEGNARVASDTPADKIPVSESQKILAPYFEAQGFVWGKAFGDSMHFQYCTGY